MSGTRNCVGAVAECSGTIESKRFWVGGAHLDWICPWCGAKNTGELCGDSISYPVLGEAEDYGLGCSECDEEVECKVTFRLTVIASKPVRYSSS